MDLTLLAILQTALCALLLPALLNAGLSGPAGRRAGLPRYQRRVLSCLTVLMVCAVVLTYQVARSPSVPRPPVAGLTLLDLLGLGAVLALWSVLRQDAGVRTAALATGAMAVLSFCVTAVGFAVLASWSHPAAAAFLSRVHEAWGLGSASLFLLMLAHYLLTAFLAALAIAGWDRMGELPAWDGDRAFRTCALTAMAWAASAVLFTLAVVV